MPRPALPAALLALSLIVPVSAQPTGPVARAGRPVTVSGVVTLVDPFGCGSRASTGGCDEHAFAVDARAGTWVTVSVKDMLAASRLLVRTADGQVEAETGDGVMGRDIRLQAQSGSVTFRQPRAGVVRYVLGLSSENPVVAADPWEYEATIRLGGAGWDRELDCTQLEPKTVPPVPADLTKPLRLAVTIVTTEELLAEVRRESAVLVQDFRSLNVAVRLSFVTMWMPGGNSEAMFDAVKKRFGGERPRGTDVVYVATDAFAGGVADCLGGVRWPERAFALGQVHYTAQGVPVPGNRVRMGHIAAHEIGHLLGAHHEHSNCAEAQPEAAARDDLAPCTVMSPAGLTITGEWSTVEAAYVRYYVEHYARG